VTISELHAHAPGKLMLLGEYSVLEGGPCLLAAINRRARVHLKRSSDTRRCKVLARQLSVKPFELIKNPQNRWINPDPEIKGSELILTVLNQIQPETGLDLELDSSEFFTNQQKLGLGSSAAICTALICAIRYPQPLEINLARHIHQVFQRGQGSGADIISSSLGGIVSLKSISPLQQQNPLQPALLSWPKGLFWQAIWTGISFSTTNSLTQLAKWQQTNYQAYQQQMQSLKNLAQTGIKAFEQSDLDEFSLSVRTYCNALDSFGQQADICIMSERHQTLRTLAENQGLVYKPSGAGGGDFGIVFAQDQQELSAWSQSLPAPFKAVSISVDNQPAGCTHDASNRLTQST